MKKLIIILLLMSAVASCKKETSNEFHAYPGLPLNDTAWISAGAYAALCDSITYALDTVSFTIDSFPCSSGTVLKLKGPGDAVIAIPPICNATGLGSPGLVKVAIGVLRKKGDFIRVLAHTKNSDKPLEASYCFYVKLMNALGQEITMPPGVNYTISWNDANASSKMNFYEGLEVKNNDTVMNWVPSINGKINQLFQQSNPFAVKGYELVSNITRWIGGLKNIDTSAGTTSVNIAFASLNFSNKNTVAYTVLKDTKTVIRMMSNNISKTFYCNKVPKSAEVIVVTISLIDKQYYLGVKQETTGTLNYFKIMPDRKKINDIQEYLDNL